MQQYLHCAAMSSDVNFAIALLLYFVIGLLLVSFTACFIFFLLYDWVVIVRNNFWSKTRDGRQPTSPSTCCYGSNG